MASPKGSALPIAGRDGITRQLVVAQQKIAIPIEGEPDPETGTLEEWCAFRRSLAALPPSDDNVRLAIAVAEARISQLSRRGRRV